MRPRHIYNGCVLAAVVFVLSSCSHIGANTPPDASVDVSVDVGYAPLWVSFDASSSSDPDGTLVRFEWDFGDGSTGRGIQVEHVFEDDGRYTVTLTVRDNRRAEDTATVLIDVLNPPPVAQLTYSPPSPVAGQAVLFNASASYDPAALRPKAIASWHWLFGDGDEDNGATVQHTYASPGTYLVTLTVVDDDGAVGNSETTLLVTPGLPPLPG